MNTNNKSNNNNNNGGSNNGNNNVGLGSGLIGKSWMSLSEQFSQIKDVMTSNDHEYDDEGYDDEDEDQQDQLLMLRTENMKFKDEMAELEKTIQQLQQRESSISKEYSNIINEKQSEISELKKDK